MKRHFFFVAMVAVLLLSSPASAGVWFELLHAPCWTGDEDDLDLGSSDAGDDILYGEHNGAIDCFNRDFNGDGARTVLSIKAFQPWKYGTMFLYYDITGPFASALKRNISDNEKGGFFGGTTVTLSIKQIYDKLAAVEKSANWGPLSNVSLKYEIEHVSKFGALHYAGLQWDFAVPFFDFLTATTVIREDRLLEGVDVQLGGAWQKSFALGRQDFIFGGFFQWGLFGEGASKRGDGSEGNSFLLTQPQLLWDVGKAVTFDPAKLYVGFEYQFTVNRYLIEGKSENTLQGMLRWNL